MNMRIEWIEPYLNEAERLVAGQRVEEGLQLLQGLLYEEPGYGYLHNHIGWAYCYYTSNIEQAERHLKYAIQFDPEYAAPYLHLGNLYQRAGRYEEAASVYERGVGKREANKPAMLESLGQAYELQQKYSEAISAYKRAIANSLADNQVWRQAIRRCRRKRLSAVFSFL